MKICDECSRVNPEDAEECIDCGCEEFTSLRFISTTNDIEPYLEDKDDNSSRERSQVP